MRVGPRKFFHTGPRVVLDCYRLAKFYAQDPDVFLAKPVSAIQQHMRWTDRLLEVVTPPGD